MSDPVIPFRFYITDLHDGMVKGTNDEAEAQGFAECEDYFVVDAKTNEWLTSGGGRQVEAI